MTQPDSLHYLGVRDAIATRIAGGELKPGERLPSERQLQVGGGVARGTIREALFQLEAEGIIYRKDRSGWYVSPPPVVYDPTRWEGFMSYVEAQGRRPETETLSKTEIACTPPWPPSSAARSARRCIAFADGVQSMAAPYWSRPSSSTRPWPRTCSATRWTVR